MPSKTLSSNKGLFCPALVRSDLIRFWPLWVLYAAVWTIAMPVIQFVCLFSMYPYWDDPTVKLRNAVQMALEMASGEGIAPAVTAIFGCLIAMALFSYLTSNRSTGFFHGLPVRREGLFLTHYLTGIGIFTAINALIALITAGIFAAAGVAEMWVIGLWFLSITGQMVFFFSFAVFCAVFAGSILAIPAFYGVLNLLALGVHEMLFMLARLFFFGWSSGGDVYPIVKWLTPIWKLISTANYTSNYDNAGNFLNFNVTGFWVVGVYAAVGVVLAALGLAVYRRRKSESAGDVVAITWAKPIFRYGVGLCAGLLFGQGLYAILWESFNDGESAAAMAVCMILTGLVGYFGAEMLLQKSFRVLKKAWKGGVALSAALVLICASYALDFFGVESYIPEIDRVESMYFNIGYYGGDTGGNTTDPELMEAAMAVQRALIQEERESKSNPTGYAETAEGGMYRMHFSIHYYLKDGTVCFRNYYNRVYYAGALEEGSALSLMAELAKDPKVQRLSVGILTDPDVQITSADLELYRKSENSQYGDYTVTSDYLSTDEAQLLADALLRDVDAGHAGVNAFDPAAWEAETYVNALQFYYQKKNTPGEDYYNSNTYYFSIHYTELLAVLEELGLKEDLVLGDEMARWEEENQRGEGENSSPQTPEESSAAIIGGADGPTGIVVAELADPAQADPNNTVTPEG